jgi:hypothetical protein
VNDILEKSRAGLCCECLHARVVRSDRGALFYQCSRSAADPAYPKYPRLPVLVCRGFERHGPEAGESPLPARQF